MIKRCWIVVTLVLSCHFPNVAAVDPPEFDGRPLRKSAVRTVTVSEDMGRCRLRKDKHGNRKYYVKKRLADRSKDPGLMEYQFIASGSDSFTPIPNQPNEVYREYGSVFCEKSIIGRVRMVAESAKHCGIEKTLARLCFIDRHVNPGTGINLQLNQIFKGEEDETTIHNVNSYCDKLVGVKMRDRNPKQNAIEYVWGAILAGYDFVVVQLTENCHLGWDILSIGDFRDISDADDFERIFARSGDFWYFCQTVWDTTKKNNPTYRRLG